MEQAQKNYDALVDQANTPGLTDAQEQVKNQDFYAKLNDPGLATFPKVPNWSVSQNAQQWVDRVKAGQGPAGATMGFANRDASYDYSQTWAQGSLSIKQFFWEVKVNGRWERVEEFESDNELEVSVEFEALDLIQIQPSDWYNGSFVRSTANGPFKRGYSAYGGDGTQAVFGEKGFMGLLKTGMYVGYKPTFNIRTSQSTFTRFLEKFEVAGGLRIGPFTFKASGGSEKSGWTASQQGQTFTGTSTSETPMIIGISIAELPNGEAVTLATEERRGTCYRFSGCEGDVLAENVIEADCYNRGGESWEAAPELGGNYPTTASLMYRKAEITYAFTATLIFGSLALASWAYDNKNLIANASQVVIDRFSDLDRAARTFKIVGSSFMACATAMNAIVKAIKENAPSNQLECDYESSDQTTVSYKDLSCIPV